MIKKGQKVKSLKNDEDGLAVIEFALVFPILFMLLLGVWDVGYGLWANQKTISASHSIADLVARQLRVSESEVSQAMLAGELTLAPFPTDDNLYIEILSVGFDSDGNIDETEGVSWEVTTDGEPVKLDLYDKIQGLSLPYEGAVAVRVSYTYTPSFGSFIIDTIEMEEIACARGRKTAVIQAEWQ